MKIFFIVGILVLVGSLGWLIVVDKGVSSPYSEYGNQVSFNHSEEEGRPLDDAPPQIPDLTAAFYQ